MADLPSLNSTTSLSDNVALRNYYENLLFRNSSGKSLTDLPKKLKQEATDGIDRGKNSPTIDFISGFRYPSYGTNTSEGSFSGSLSGSMTGNMDSTGSNTSQSQSRPVTMDAGHYWMGTSDSDGGLMQAQQSQYLELVQRGQQAQMFSLGASYEGPDSMNSMGSLTLPFQPVGGISMRPESRENNISSVGPSSGSVTMSGMFGGVTQQRQVPLSANMSPVNSAGNSIFGNYLSLENNAFAPTRRSSYISDQLIHGQQQQLPVNTVYDVNAPRGYTRQQNSFGQQTQTQQQKQKASEQQQPVQVQMSNHSAQSHLHSNIEQVYKETAPQSQPHSQSMQRNKPIYPQKHASVPQINYTPPGNNGGISYNEGSTGNASGKVLEPQVGTYPLDNGLILCNGRIVSSPDLKQLYRSSSSHYFSAKECFQFIDELKGILYGENSASMSTRNAMILKFVAFLKNCNLNCNPQSDAFVSNNQLRRASTSVYLHYKPLVLVALKNGKLELLSLPQSTNLDMDKEDLVIIDGDRGKDLAIVIEPKVEIELALFINFLKKKIHFDSLITAVDQHYPNERFIQALMDSTNNGNGKGELNHKLYEVIELTQLIIPSKQVLRFATSWEVSTNLYNKFQDELKALHIAHLKLKSLNSGCEASGAGTSNTNASANSNEGSKNNSTNNASGQAPNNKSSLNIKILNAEFQFDRKKLTFYYVCQERNDFRELIKELFKFYKTRIWLCAIPNNLGIDKKYYDENKKEWAMYQEMMKHYANDDLTDSNSQNGLVAAPPLYEIELDNFQLGVYKELVANMFP
ncbi:HCL633Wp [Eremothecium sinecaudum]|uniref:HCL633Wp n=1 Tax=Eremothecium sinecaudum TaxID=45286 RepID=A0A109UXU2_9SACH|nr:HCL633Wp [Eremothecium sinecaudum]AMD19518.1 HCL633Wp [Eremothecium sinecaudum]